MSKEEFRAPASEGEHESMSMNNTSVLSSSVMSSLSNNVSSGTSDLRFSKRSSDLSEEAKQQLLKPAEVLLSKRKSEKVFPVSTLRFSELKLVGREDEKKMLDDCLKRVAPEPVSNEQTGSRELVLISGNAGTGKTALASALAKSVKKLNGLYVRGKFDLYLRDEPYSGIAAACREICGRALLMREDESFAMIRNELMEKLGPDNLCLLINIIPELAEIVGDEVIMDEMTNQASGESKARFNFAFRVLIRVVSSRFAPLVILLDDLQWADAATLDLLQVLIGDRDNPSLMMIGIYRSNEVDESHPLTRLICGMKRMSEQDDFNVTEIEIGNLSASQVNDVVMSLLSVDDPEKTRPLADLCFKRTYGNAFSLLIFLKMLQSEGLLSYSLGMFKWDWDEAKILSATAATSNVVDLMKQKIEKLPASVGQRLSIAACLGFSFEPSILNTVWTTIFDKQESTEEADLGEDDDIGSFLALVEQEGFLEVEPGSSTAYRWVHDKVQEAAISLVPNEELPGLKAQVGKILVSELDDERLDSYIFTVVSLLHEGEILEESSERIQLAELSLKASRKAKDQSAFESAAKYAAIGIEALPANKWSDHYDVTLDLYSTGAEVACSLGNIDELEELYKEVMGQSDRPLLDKLRAYHAAISHLLGALGKHNDLNVIEMIVDILAQLGMSFPKKKRAISQSIKSGTRKAISVMSSLSPEDISNLPMMEDTIRLEMMRLLDRLFMATYFSANELMPLTIFASIELTLEHGLSKYSALAFVSLALLFREDDPALASKTGNFARLAMASVDSSESVAKAAVWLEAFSFCWTEPMTRMIPRLYKAYGTGLSVGDNENALWCIAQYMVMGFQTGKPLKNVETDCKIYLKQMVEFEREVVHADISIFLEMIRNLIGRYDGDPTVMNQEQRFLSHSDHTVLGFFYTCRSVLYLYFGDYEKGAVHAIERGDSYAQGIPGHAWIMSETFARGMLLYAMAQKKGKRHYKKEAKRVRNIIKTWVRKGNPNVLHYDLLLNAEDALLSGKLDAAEEWYQKAIVAATRQGCIHESGLARERYGEFLLGEKNDPEEARHKFDDALRCYSEWGAGKKVKLLREKHEGLWQKPTEVVF